MKTIIEKYRNRLITMLFQFFSKLRVGMIVFILFFISTQSIGQTTLWSTDFETASSIPTYERTTGVSLANTPSVGVSLTKAGTITGTSGASKVYDGAIMTSLITLTSGKDYVITVYANVSAAIGSLDIIKSTTQTNAAMKAATGSNILLNGSSNVTSTTYAAFTASFTASTTENVYIGFQMIEAGSTNGATMNLDNITIVEQCTSPSSQATVLTSSSITTTTMTIGWTRGNGDAGVVVVARAAGAVNADVTSGTNYTANAAYGSGTQVGTGNYVVYKGTGTSVNLTALSALTAYHFAVYEYNTTSTCFNSTELTGNATTLAGTYTSTTSGNWNATGTWLGGVVPTANDNAVIANGHTVTITAAANCNNLTVGQGASGILIFEATTARTLTVGGDLTIASGGQFQSASTGTQTGHSLSIAGSITNNGTLDFSTNSNTAAAGITFTGANNTTFSGTGGTTDLKTLTINKGSSATSVLELSPSNFSIQGVTTDVAGFLTLTNGTFKISGSFTMTNRVFTSASYTIESTCKFHLNNSNFTVAAQAADARYNGSIEVDAGTYNVGINSDESFNFGSTTSTFTLDGGAVNIAGQFVGIVGNTVVYTQTGGALTVCTVGNTYDASGSFYLPSENTFNMSGGTIVCRLSSTATPTPRDYNNSAGTRSVTGGTLQLGDASSGVAKSYVITGYIPNLLVTNTSGNHTAKLYSLVTPYIYLTTTLQTGTTLNTSSNTVSATFNGDITFGTSSSFLAGTGTQTINANWINNGTLTPSTGTINFNGGSAQTISGASTTSFYNLIIANTSGGVSLAVNSTVTNTLTLTSGKLTVQGYTLAIGTNSANGSISGGTSTAYIVAYDNSGTIGYVKRFVNSNAVYSYPIGDASNYVPLTFTLTSATLSNAYLTIFNKATKVTGLNPSITTNYIARHWNVTESGFTNPTYSISYTYVDGDIVGSETGMLPVKKSVSTWYKPTGSLFSGTAQGTGSFTAASNLLSWTGLTTFSLFGGVAAAAVVLPIELVSFTGKKDRKNNELKWTTATELNNDFFTIEKTLDGTNFEIVGIENGAGHSNQYSDYSLIDYDVREVINYYRLKQTDLDGKYNFSEIISIDNRTNNKEIAFITNILGQEVNENYRGLVVIVYSDGTSVKLIQL